MVDRVRSLWAWRGAVGVVLFVMVGAMRFAHLPVPLAVMYAPAVVLMATETEAVLRRRQASGHVAPRRVAYRTLTSIVAVFALALVSDAWWISTTALALMLVSASAALDGRPFVLVTLVAIVVNMLVPVVVNAVPWMPVRTVDFAETLRVSFTVFPMLALILHRRSLHLVEAQLRLRETIAHLQHSQRALLTSQGQLEQANAALHASVDEQTAELADRNRYLSIINSVSFALAEPMDGTASLERAVRLIARLLGARAAQLYEAGDVNRNGQHVFVTVAPEDVQTPRLPESVLRSVVSAGRPITGGPDAPDGAPPDAPTHEEPYAVVPVASKGIVLGAFAVLGIDPAWGDQQRHLLLIIGREFGAALESANLYREAVERARLEEASGDVARLLSGTEAQDRAVQLGLQYVSGYLHARQTLLVGYPDGPRRPRVIAGTSADTVEDRQLAAIAQSVAAMVSDRIAPLVLGSGGEAPLSQALEAQGIGTLVAAPIIGTAGSGSMLPSREQPGEQATSARRVMTGVLVIVMPAGVPWRPASTELVGRATRLLAQRMQADELIALQRQRIRELAGLAEIARIMQSGVDSDRLYAGFAQALRTLVQYRRLYVARLDEFGQLLGVPVFGARGREEPPVPFAPADRGHRWFALRNSFAWQRTDDAAPSFIDTDARTCLVVPMRPKGQVLGVVVLALDTTVSGDQLHIVEQAVEQLALALDNATLYQQATARASHIQALSNLARIVASVVDLREAFAAFGEEVRWLIPFDRAVMLLVDEDRGTVQSYATYPEDAERRAAIPLAGSIASLPVSAGGAVVLRQDDPDCAGLDWSILGADVRDVAAVPVMQGNRVAAIFALVHSTGSSLGPIDLDAMEEVAGLLGVTIERLRLYERAEYSANHDMLTGLPNYRYLQQRLATLREGISEPGESAVFMIDMDGLKLFNDSLGHEAGDQVIQIVARELKRISRADDFVARTGGDEFVVVMEGVGPTTAENIAERMHEALREAHLEVPGAPARLGVSIGIATAPHDADTVPALVHAADQAMYEAKFAGGQRTRMASDGTTARGTRSVPRRDTRLAETMMRAATDGATALERSAISLAQRWTVGLMSQRSNEVEAAPWVRMIVAHAAMSAIATPRVGRDQQAARFFLEALYRDWESRDDETARAVVKLAPLAIRLAWAHLHEPDLVGMDTDAAVAWSRLRLNEQDDRALAESLYAFVLSDRTDRRRARSAA